MGDPAMPLRDEDIRRLAEQVKPYLKELVEESVPRLVSQTGERAAPTSVQLLERIVRVEEELKGQRELMKQGFEAMEKRFESADKRFESVDKRFEDLQHNMDKRFAMVQWGMGLGFVVLGTLVSVFGILA